MTNFSNKVKILAKLWIDFRDDEKLKDFIEYNDMGLPLAYLSNEGLCELSTDGERYIEETWTLFVKSLGIEDTGFEDIEEMFQASLEDK